MFVKPPISAAYSPIERASAFIYQDTWDMSHCADSHVVILWLLRRWSLHCAFRGDSICLQNPFVLEPSLLDVKFGSKFLVTSVNPLFYRTWSGWMRTSPPNMAYWGKAPDKSLERQPNLEKLLLTSKILQRKWWSSWLSSSLRLALW